MNVSYWISQRLRLRGEGGSGTGVIIAVAGVALALVIMELTIAVVLGFKNGIRDKLMGFDAQINVEVPYGSTDGILHVTPSLRNFVRTHMPASDIRMSLRQPALLKTDTDFHGLVFLAQSPEADFSFERSNIVEGEWPDYTADSCDNKIVISRQVADALGLGVGDRVFSTFFVNGDIKMRRHTVAGLYRSDFGEYDYNVAYASLRAMQRVAGIDSVSCNRLDIRGIAVDDIASEAASLQQAFIDAAANGEMNELYTVDNVTHTGAIYFNWLDLLDTNVVVIFLLMLAVAGLTLVSSLFILILECVRLIGVLRAMGAPKPLVRRIFIDMAMRLVGLGMIIGNILGLGLLWFQHATHFITLDPQMYYLSSVPVEFNIWAIIALNAGVAASAWLILVLPARLASSIDPAKAMSYE